MLDLLKERGAQIKQFKLEYYNLRHPDDKMDEVITRIKGGYKLELSASYLYDNVRAVLKHGDDESLFYFVFPLDRSYWKLEKLERQLELSPKLIYSEDESGPDQKELIESFGNDQSTIEKDYHEKRRGNLLRNMLIWLVGGMVLFGFLTMRDAENMEEFLSVRAYGELEGFYFIPSQLYVPLLNGSDFFEVSREYGGRDRRR